MFFIGRSGHRPGVGGEFVESLVADAVVAHIRMKDTEWAIYTDVRAPRGALSYPRLSREELKGGSWV